MTYKQVVETLVAEMRKRGLYDAVSSRIDRIIEAAAMLWYVASPFTMQR